MMFILILLCWFIGYNNAGYYNKLQLNELPNPHSKTLTRHYYGYPDEVLLRLIEEAPESIDIAKAKDINPAELAWKAQLLWEWYVRHPSDRKTFNRFIFYANWLKSNISLDEGCYGCWRFNFPIYRRHMRLDSGWVSALAQGHGISIMAKAFQVSGDSTYLNAAFFAMAPFKRGVNENGVLSSINFYEEYPAKPDGTHVLNGFISSLLGLYDLYRATGDTSAFRLFTSGINSLKNVIDKYDTGSWSRYSLTPYRGLSNRFDLSSPFYHRLHILQLKTLYNITGIDIFEHYAQRWEKYEKTAFAFIWENLYYIYKGAKSIEEFYSGKKASLFSPVS